MLKPFAAAFSCLAAVAVAAQDFPTFRASVALTVTDVTVLDRDRKPVRGLTADDFVVTENGVRQTVQTLTEIVVPRPEATGAPWTREIGPDVVGNSLDSRRLVVILLNDGEIGIDGSALTPPIAHAIIDQLGPSDLAAVITSYLGRFENFTNDRSKLRAAVDTFLPQVFKMGPPIACRLKPMGKCGLDALRRAGEILATGPPGRKIVFSIGPPQPLVSFEADALSSLGPTKQVIEGLQAANATVYEINPNGLQIGRPLTRDTDEIAFAESTGGRVVRDTNAPQALIPTLFEETSSYYLIGYQSTNTQADGRFRRVRVTVDRPDVDVIARAGYFGPPRREPRARAAPPLAPADAAIARGLPSGDLPIAVTVAAFAGPNPRMANVVALMRLREAPVRDLPSLQVSKPSSPQVPTQQVTTVMAAFDTNWRSRGVFRQTVELQLTPGADRDSEVEIGTMVPLEPGRYELRFASERSGEAGSVFVSLDVPDFARDPVSLSGVLIEILPASHLSALGSVAALVPVVPTTVRTFSRGDRASAFLRVYQRTSGAAQAVTVTTTIKNEQDAVVAQQIRELAASAFGQKREVDYRYELPTSELPAGQYLLTVEAKREDRRVVRQVTFSIGP